MRIRNQGSWQRFWHDVPGRRFAHRHERLRQNGEGPARRVLRSALGVLLIVAGVIFVPLPGPGIVLLLAGAALLAGLSWRIANWLDRAELRVRRWVRRD